MNISSLLEAYQVDQAHARQVADLALALFDAVAERYALPAAQRRLVELGALLHNVGLTTDPPAHHLVGRDIVLRHMIEDVTPREQALVACIVAFHRKKVRPELEPAYLALSKKGQREALRLAALVRVADGLDYHQAQATRLLGVKPSAEGLVLQLAGPFAAEDGARAVAKADLWFNVFGESLRISLVADPAADALVPPAALSEDETPSLDPWFATAEAPLAELGRVLLRRHLRRLRDAERDVRADKAMEAIHVLRVTTRRLRATLKLLASVYTAEDLRDFNRGLGRLARTAGAVRDRDVLLADLRKHAKALPQPELAALTAAVQAERATAQRNLRTYLDSDRYAAFVRAFATAMNDPGCWDNTPRVRDLAGSMLWRHYEALRAYDRGGLPAEEAQLHMMRIEGKRMRYLLELFSDTLGPQLDQAVKPLMAFQDHLGVLNDIAVARELLAEHQRHPARAAAVEAYLALREEQAATLLSDLPVRWNQLSGLAYRRTLMELVLAL
ncbi:MAG: CHAD domain-containing protein [Oscillochloridaceae bacterium umkhey_bin13]